LLTPFLATKIKEITFVQAEPYLHTLLILLFGHWLEKYFSIYFCNWNPCIK